MSWNHWNCSECGRPCESVPHHYKGVSDICNNCYATFLALSRIMENARF